MLTERGVEFDVIEYMKTPLDEAPLTSLVDKVPNEPADMVRNDKNFKELGLDPDDYVTPGDVVALLVEHPVLMQRPILVKGDNAVIARPSDKVFELVD